MNIAPAKQYYFFILFLEISIIQKVLFIPSTQTLYRKLSHGPRDFVFFRKLQFLFITLTLMMIFSHNDLNALFKMVENMFLCLIKVSAIQINIVLENLYKCLIPLHLILTEQR